MKKRVISLLMGSVLFISAWMPMIGTARAAEPDVQGYGQEQEGEEPLRLWYDEPASVWKKEALPVGNGHISAMVFGKTDTERLQLNEKTLWTGGPDSNIPEGKTDADMYGNKNVADPAATMKGLVDTAFENFYAGTGSSTQPSAYLPNNRYALGNYQNFAETYIDFQHTGATNYQRYLDLNTAVTGVSYDFQDVSYTREMFADYPDNVMVYRIKASKNGAVNFTLRPQIPNKTSSAGGNVDKSTYGKTGTVFAEGDTITIDGSLNHNGMQFEGQYKVITEGGSIAASNDENKDNGQIRVEGADSAYIIIALGTDYVNDFEADYKGEDPHAAVTQRIENAAGLGYEGLYANHTADYQGLFKRVDLDLNSSFPEDKTTDTLLEDYKKGNRNHYLEELYFQYGRYLLIASSRETSLPANLQGIWNDSEAPMWQSDYHTNINLQMNYWPAYETNLAETAEPLVDYIDSLREPGRITFQKTWGIQPAEGDTESGWIVNCSNGPLGFTGNINSTASFTATGAAFIAQNLYDYYRFTSDTTYLKEKIYPILKESCKTYLQILEPGRGEDDQDRLYMVPSYSSEQGPWTVGTYFDQQLLYQIFSDTADAADQLEVDTEFAAELRQTMTKLYPVEIGAEGQVKEWQQEVNYNKDANGKTLGESAGRHRHNSQLVALYPGNLINSNTPEWMDAAKVTLNKRGDDATGWSMGHKLNLWARLQDGNRAYVLLNNLISNGTFNNLFDFHQPDYFQIDGNFGGTAGITEMLLQSQSGIMDLLPAIPDDWEEGSYQGLVARGNFTVDLDWTNGEAEQAVITSNAGNRAEIRAERIGTAKVADSSGKQVEFTATEKGTIRFDTKEGETYTVTLPNRSSLSKLAKEAENTELILYTAASVQALKEALAQAQAILDAESFTEEDVKKAEGELRRALDGLQPRGEAYNHAIEAVRYAESLAETPFASSDGWEAVQENKTALQTAMDEEQKDLSTTIAALLEAIGKLQIVAGSEMVDDADVRVIYGFGPDGPDTGAGNKGQWYRNSNAKYSNGGISVCKSAWAWAELPFTGSRVTYVIEKAQGSSQVNVYIDGTLAAEKLDSYDSGNGIQNAVLFDSADYLTLEDGEHTIKVETTGDKNPASSSLIFRVDGFEVFSGTRKLADKGRLIEAAAKARGIEKRQVEPDGYRDLKEIEEAAREVLADVQAEQDQVDASASNLKEALELLVFKNYDGIVQAVADARQITLEEYVTAGKKQFGKALEDAEALLEKDESTQAMLNEAAEALEYAQAVLKKRADIRSLAGVIEEAEKKDLSLYTDETAALLENSIAMGRELLKDAELSVDDQVMVDRTVQVIADAVANLKAPDPVKVTGIKLDQNELRMKTGDKKTLKAEVLPANAEDPSLNWESSDEKVASVDTKGNVTAKGNGRAWITAASKDGSVRQASCEVTVAYRISYQLNGGTNHEENPKSYYQETLELYDPAKTGYEFMGWYLDSGYQNRVLVIGSRNTGDLTLYAKWEKIREPGEGKVTGVTLDQGSLRMQVKDNAALKAEVLPADADDPSLIWESSDESVAAVGPDGVLTAKNWGQALITATARDGSNKRDYCMVTVTYPIKYELNGGENSEENPQEYYDEVLQLHDAVKDGGVFAGWFADPSFRTPVKMITRDMKGVLTLYAKWESPRDPEEGKVTGVLLGTNSLSMKQGELKALTAQVLPASAENKTLNWESSNEKAVTVDQNGTLTAKAGGRAVVTASARDGSGKYAVCIVTVSYRISYELNGGRNHAVNPEEYLEEALTLKAPVKKGYAFKGWYLDAGFRKKADSIDKTMEGNLTFYAKWEKVKTARTAITSLKNQKKRQAAVTFKKISGAQGYQIVFAQNKKMTKGRRTVNSRVAKVTLKKLSKGKVYYVKVRAYKKDSAENAVYGKYSGRKKVRINK